MCVEGTFPRPSVCAVCVGARASREPSFIASYTLYSHRYTGPHSNILTFLHFATDNCPSTQVPCGNPYGVIYGFTGKA